MKIPNDQYALDIVKHLTKLQQQSMEEENIDLWMSITYIKDDIAVQMREMWFKGYISKIRPRAISTHLDQVTVRDQTIYAYMSIILEYTYYDTLRETHEYVIAFEEEIQAWRIILMEKKPQPFSLFMPYPSKRFDFGAHLTESSSPWWKQDDYLHYIEESTDPLHSSLYAKAIARTVRSREEHPELECAAILADMLSVSVHALARQIGAHNPLEVLAHLYTASQEQVTFSLTRSERNNTWHSKLHAPWYGFDEMLGSQTNEHISGSCPSLMSFYAALLRLNIFSPLHIFQLRLHNHDVLLIKIQQEIFLLCLDKLVKVNTKTLYYTNRVYKVFNDTWYFTGFGATNLDEKTRTSFLDIWDKKETPFLFNNTVISRYEHIQPFDAALHAIDNRSSYHHLKKRVLQFSRDYPFSTFTWAKYAYQTLYVSKPETYALWSLQTNLLAPFLLNYTHLQPLILDIARYKNNSLFFENDRIMTADQVIRHKMGDAQSKALLLFAAVKKMRNTDTCVLLTDQSSYCIWLDEKRWVFWDMAQMKEVREPEGHLLLAFDDTGSYSPFLKPSNVSTMQAWYTVVS